jgi:hypothetical protein
MSIMWMMLWGRRCVDEEHVDVDPGDDVSAMSQQA